jgi:hypothetical protein
MFTLSYDLLDKNFDQLYLLRQLLNTLYYLFQDTIAIREAVKLKGVEILCRLCVYMSEL